jgi:hypothetical protein
MHYFILALSKNRAQLFEVTGNIIVPRGVEGMPTSMAEAWKGTERDEQSAQSHPSGDGMTAMHGQGGAKDAQEQEEDVYLHAVAKSLHTLLHNQHDPLVFFGVEEAYGMFKKFDQSGRLLEEYVRGNPDHLTSEELKEKAEPIVRTYQHKQSEPLIEEYGNLLGTGRTSNDIAVILDAAHKGKVDLLLLEENAMQWGTFDEATGAVTLHSSKQDDSQELHGLAVLHTIKHHGRIANTEKGKIPEGAVVAAILRQ